LIRAALFDLDGTLVDTPRAIVEVTQSTLAALGLPRANEQQIRDGIGLPLPQALAQLLGSGTVGASEAVEVYRTIWRSVVTPQLPKLVFPGVVEGIEELRLAGLRLGVVTGKAQEGADSTVGLMGLRHPFDVVLGYTSVARGKPAPDLAIEALRRLGIAADEAIVVGDSTLDLEMARAAGVRTIAVTYGAQSREALTGADFYAGTFLEVVEILRAER
jgi:phosphoglycolate phosphatase